MYYLRYIISGLIAAIELYHSRPFTALAAFTAANWAWSQAEEYANTKHNQKQTQRWKERQHQCP